MTQNYVDYSEYNNVFCDSLEALEWAYKQGLPKDAIIRASSPAMLWENNPKIIHIESDWDLCKMKEFQTSIQKFSEEIYDKSTVITGITHEESLCVAQISVSFHQLLFKAACLTNEDLTEPRLFISVDGYEGPGGKNMNSPWDKLLASNSKFKTLIYELSNDKWNTLTTNGVSFFDRIRIGGMETLIYRLLVKFTNKLPSFFLDRQALVVNENELLIETAASLILNNVRIKEIKPTKYTPISIDQHKLLLIKKSIQSIVNKRIKSWVIPSLIEECEEIFFQQVKENLNSFVGIRAQYSSIIKEAKRYKNVLLINSPGNIKGLAITSICREAKIPVVSFQHGVTHEICAIHKEVSVNYEINTSDLFIAYNNQSEKIFRESHFIKGTSFVAGISARHLRMKSSYCPESIITSPIVYVSTNLYRGNKANFVTWETDYGRAINESLLIANVFSLLPHKVCYKPYPEDNRHYADNDPIIPEVCLQENIDLFSNKVDMRYLLDRHRILVTSAASSTVSWLVMSGKPVVFINQRNTSPLSENAHTSFSKGLFLFDDDNKNFHAKLRNFLSLPIEDIEELWKQKKDARKEMINQFFTSSCHKGAGKVAAKFILNKYYKSTV